MNDTPFVDVAFPLSGKSLPLDHGYPLFAAVSRVVPRIHEERSWGIHPVYGLRIGPGLLALNKTSLLTIRAPVSEMGTLLPLAGHSLDVAGHRASLGIPRVFPLRVAERLRSRFVTIKSFEKEPADFEGAVRRQLNALDIGDVAIKVGERRVLRVSAHTIVGFSLELSGLSAPASVRVQSSGIGGRRHIGAGLFLPVVSA